jgi:peptidoglycan/xylan/chitin deacetylase (PgdA/CDA1 family)
MVKRLFPGLVWSMPENEKALYLTFDDGPTPEVTDFVLEQLKRYNAKATFFCIGKNVQRSPGLTGQLLAAGHSIGNHTFSHLNGWKTATDKYIKDVIACESVVKSQLFRPPYGRIKTQQVRQLQDRFRIVMWDVLSGDFDRAINGEKCAQNVIRRATNGSVVVFHDSLKAEPRLRPALPLVLEHFSERGFEFRSLTA